MDGWVVIIAAAEALAKPEYSAMSLCSFLAQAEGCFCLDVVCCPVITCGWPLSRLVVLVEGQRS